MLVKFSLNGETVEVETSATRTLLDWLRDERGLRIRLPLAKAIIAGADAELIAPFVDLLADEVIEFTHGEHTVHVGGLRTHSQGTPERAATIAALAAAPTADLTVLVSHRPDSVGEVDPGSIDLVVAGHTHGGQIALPLIGALFTQSDLPRQVAGGGLHAVAGQPIYVSTGVGLERSKAPQVRFGVRPSVGLIEVSSAG